MHMANANCFVFFNPPKQASRAQILRKAAEFIQFMRRKNQSHQINIEDLKRQNNMLETQSTYDCDWLTKRTH